MTQICHERYRQDDEFVVAAAEPARDHGAESWHHGFDPDRDCVPGDADEERDGSS